MADQSDPGLLQWAMGLGATLAATLIAAAFGHVHTRINGVEERSERRMHDGDDTLAQEIARLRERMDDRAVIDDKYRQEMAEKVGALPSRAEMRGEFDRMIAAVSRGGK